MAIYVGNKKISGPNINSTAPVGTIISYSSDLIPGGYLLCNGQEVGKTDYAILYSIIGDNFGTPTDSTKFKVPDLSSNALIEHTNYLIKAKKWEGEVTDTKHDHSNKEQLDKISEDTDGNVLYNGKKIKADSKEWTGTSNDWNALDKSTLEDGTIINIKDDNGTSVVHGKNATISINTNNEYKYTLDLKYKDENDVEQTITTPNLKDSKVEIVPNINNNEYSYKLDINSYDGEGIKTTVTTDELKQEKIKVSTNKNNDDYSYRVDFTTTDNNGTDTVLTSAELKGNTIFTGTIVDSGENDSVVATVEHSKIRDLYINSDTSVLYRRTDKDLVANTWEKVNSIKGANGDDNYTLWKSLDGNSGKSLNDYFNYLRNNTKTIAKCWDKPLLSDDTTELNVVYYYQTGDNAWLNKIHLSDDKDYPPSTYTYFDGIKWLTFTTTTVTVPAMSQKDTYEFYVIYDEKNSKCLCHSVNKATGEDIVLGNWADIYTSDSKPTEADVVEISDENYEKLGVWKTTVYLGDTKTDCFEVTETGTQALEGVVTQDSLNDILGTVDLKTTNKQIKKAINELNSIIRMNTSDSFNTQNKTIIRAINELNDRQNVPMYLVKDKSILDYAKTLTGTLKTYFFYGFNCSDVPAGTNGYGYGMVIISNDTYYRNLIYYGTDPRKMYIATIGDNGLSGEALDFGEWSQWYTSIDNSDIADNLTTDDASKVLSARQGTLLKAMMPVGVVLPYASNIIPSGYLLCDGQAVSRTTYAELFNIIGTTYGSGNGSTTFNLPNLQNKFIEGAGTNAVGTEMSAGLPNITGGFIPGSVPKGHADYTTGAFKGTKSNSGVYKKICSEASATYTGYGFEFNASKSNSIYGNSTTVQPPAICLNYIIKAI